MRQPASKATAATIGIIGIGNPLMGDDGAGIAALEKIASRRRTAKMVFLHELRHDLFEMADLLDRAERFIFIDVFLGQPVGMLSIIRGPTAVLPPSLHQTDIGTVMRMLEPLDLVDPFPTWEVWGIAVEPPFILGAGLSKPVALGVDRLVEELHREIGNLPPDPSSGSG
jgi:hydrogenase maturation protease